MEPNQQQPIPQDQPVAWWLRFLARAIGTLGGAVALATGLFTCISFQSFCILAGVLQMLAGFIVILFEAPCCCQFIEFADKISKFSENRPYWQKGMLYCFISLVPMMLCFEMSAVFGSVLDFACGVLYGMMFLGKKGDRDSMLMKARGDDIEMKKTLIGNEEEKIDLHVPESSR